MDLIQYKQRLKEKGLKITPQRVIIYEAIVALHNHPTAEKIIGYIHQHHPNISTGTVYHVLETLVKAGLIDMVQTARDKMRYDGDISNHYHLYCEGSDRIEDYYDEELHALLEDYFRNKSIPGFSVENIKLHLIGKFRSTPASALAINQ